MRTVDHRFALGMPGLPTALPKKLLTPGRPVEKLRLPTRDLVRMNVKLLGQLNQRLLALDGCQCNLRLTWGRSGQVRYHQGDIG
jgi:hypothetical protein